MFHDVAPRTIDYWESGRNAVPDGAVQELLELNALIERGVQNILLLVGELASAHGQPAQVALTRYRTLDDYRGSRADLDGLPWACHNAMIGRAMVALARQGQRAAISYGQAAP